MQSASDSSESVTFRSGSFFFFRNDGDGTFADATVASGLDHPEPGYGFGALFIDFDDDGDVDLYIANDSTPNFLYHNEGDGIFIEAGLRANAAFNETGLAQAGMGVAWGDYDGDGKCDLFFCGLDSVSQLLSVLKVR